MFSDHCSPLYEQQIIKNNVHVNACHLEDIQKNLYKK